MAKDVIQAKSIKNIFVAGRKKERKITRAWYDETVTLFDEDVHHIIVCNDESPKPKETARNWASGKGKFELTLENKPIKKARLIDLDFRSEGGRAYQIVYGEDNWMCDLREDTLMDCLMSKGVVNGIFQDDLIWATIGSATKLVMFGGPTYAKIVEAVEYKAQPFIPLEVGNEYEGGVYLGKFKVGGKTQHVLAHIYDHGKTVYADFYKSMPKRREVIKKGSSRNIQEIITRAIEQKQKSIEETRERATNQGIKWDTVIDTSKYCYNNYIYHDIEWERTEQTYIDALRAGPIT